MLSPFSLVAVMTVPRDQGSPSGPCGEGRTPPSEDAALLAPAHKGRPPPLASPASLPCLCGLFLLWLLQAHCDPWEGRSSGSHLALGPPPTSLPTCCSCLSSCGAHAVESSLALPVPQEAASFFSFFFWWERLYSSWISRHYMLIRENK